MNTPDIQTRRAFTASINDAMQGAAKRRDGQRLPQGRVKSYLLDVHQSDTDAQSGLLHLFRGAVEGMHAGVAETEDAHFYVLHTDSDKETIFLDAADPRFVVAHTTGYADKTDRIMHKLVEASPIIDRVWLPSPFLISKAQDIGRVTRRAISFDSHTFWTGRTQRANDLWEDDVDADVAESDVPIGKQFSLDFRDRKENTVAFDQLYRIPDFADAMSFSRGDVARQLALDNDVYSAARIYNWGKLSGAGTSAQIHLAIVANVRNAYRSVLQRIEDEFAFEVRGEKPSSARLHGNPLSIEFPAPLPNPRLFAKRVFSGRRPFMLWGIPQVHNEDYISVQALDMHVQRQIYCELMPTGLRIYLWKGACANSVARLYTNLLSYCDARARLWGKGEADALLQ